MKHFLAAAAVALVAFGASAQSQLTLPPSGGNERASVTQQIGLVHISIDYSSPHVRSPQGVDRRGKIWGTLVPWGLNNLGFGTCKECPWRVGANVNTIFTTSHDIQVNGSTLPAGSYALFAIPQQDEWTWIFSKNNTSWGSFFYDPKEDALRVKVKPVPLDNSVEWLRYEFKDQKESSATIALEWEKLSIPFKVETDLIQTQLASFRRELRSDKGFTWNAWDQAAQFCIQHNTSLDEALAWSDYAITAPFVGQKNFQTLSTKAQVLSVQGKKDEADVLMKEALPLGQMAEVHQYARQLLMQKRGKDAFDAFKLNYDKHPGEFTTNMGMARGYSAVGDYKKALAFLQKAQAQAPDKANKDNIEKYIPMLQQGKDIN